MHKSKTQTAILCATLAVMVVAAPAWAKTERGAFDRTLSVSGSVTLDVMTPYGEITVTPGPAGTVTINARVKAKSNRHSDYTPEEIVRMLTENPPIEQDGNVIRIGAISEEERDKGLYQGTRIYYEITVPADTAVNAKSGYGDIAISGITRPAEVRTGYGNVTLASPAGGVTVKTGYGDITIEGALTEDWELKTGYGNVKLDLPSDASFELDARTGFGDIDTEHPIVINGRLRHSRIRGTVRDGGPALTIKTGFGDITLN